MLDTVAPELDLQVWRVEFDHRPTMLSVTEILLERFTSERPSGNKSRLIGPLVDQLRSPLVLMVDETQRLNRECIDHLRFLHDHRLTDFTLIFAGGQGCWEVLGKEPQLRSRIYRPVFFRPLTGEEVLSCMPRFHPVWTEVSEAGIQRIDIEFANGVLRHWASITHTMTQLTEQRPDLDEIARIDIALLKHGVLGDQPALV